MENNNSLLYLENRLEKKILFLDGAMGTMVQTYKLEEPDYRGKRSHSHTHPLKGNNDLLSLTKPEIIRKRFDEHLKGDKQWHYFLWKVLMFVEWQKNNSISIK